MESVMTEFSPSPKRDDETYGSFTVRCIRQEMLHNLRTQIEAMDVSGASSGYIDDDFGSLGVYASGLESSKDRILELLDATTAKA
jgi:hypothetical protein